MKQYNPKSIKMYVAISIFVSIIGCGVYSIIGFSENKRATLLEWTGLIIIVFGIIYFIYLIYRFLNRRIVLFEDRIYTTKDVGNRDVILQYELEVMFNQIEKISLSLSSKNSLNQNLPFVITPMPYIVLHLTTGQIKRINVYFYSKKQTIEIIDYIIDKKHLINKYFVNDSGAILFAKLLNNKQ